MDVNKRLEDMEATLKAGLSGTITLVAETSSSVFYGSKEYGDREGIAVTVELDEHDKKEGMDFEIKEFFGMPEIGGYYKSNIFAFKKRYGKAPEDGLKVKLTMSDTGFWRIEY